MGIAQPTATQLIDYTEPNFWVNTTELTFELQPESTLVTARLELERNTKRPANSPLELDGHELELISVSVNGNTLSADQYQLSDEQLIIPDLPDSAVLETKVKINPANNTALDGLYRSGGMYCTQCEAQGFRRITFYPDRPDVMSVFTTHIVADAKINPVMLSNGNLVSGEETAGVRTVTWHDPHKKPSYLFALVAGDLLVKEDRFVTQSGREVALKLYVEPQNIDKTDYALDALKRSMRWDEEVYGREYDLDIFMIVAVDDFNMGAMENKGLNIFNSSCVLANPATATDTAYQRIESIVAHEYFHNWSGNRVTCRDWFQLSLKEGLTVYRDEEFSADMNSRAVKRIEGASFMRNVQFVEDAGPMAHPVRPDSYLEISNFYTMTIYEKGAEVVRMLANILGPENYRKGTDLYFKRFDGQAVTCDDFVACMEEASGKDLHQFRLWYSQAGTPQLHISDSYDAERQQYHLHVRQHTPETPGQPLKQALHIPLKITLYGEQGAQDLIVEGKNYGEETVLDICREQQTIVFDNITEKPSPSLLREFSAPVKIDYDYQLQQLQQLVLLDSDGFCRWDAVQNLMGRVLHEAIEGDSKEPTQDALIQSLKRLLQNFSAMDMGLLACLLDLPSEHYVASRYEKADPAAISQARTHLQHQLALALEPELLACYQALAGEVAGLSAEAMAARSLRNRALGYLMCIDKAIYRGLAEQQFFHAENMTDQFAALKAMVHAEHAHIEAQHALQAFYQQWQNDALVVNMWLQVQATKPWGDVLRDVRALLEHPAFDKRNPNKLRAVIAAFANQNFSQFHQLSGEAYQFLAEQIADIDQRNPQIAARLLTPLTHWHQFIAPYGQLMKAALDSLSQHELSKDVYEVLSKSLVEN